MYMPEHPVDSAVRALGFEASAQRRLEVVWEAYEAATGNSVDRPPTTSQRQDVLGWLRVRDDTYGWAEFYAKQALLTPMLHRTVAEKASRLVQLGCRTCTLDETAPGASAVTFPVGIPPWSAQSQRDRVAIRQAVRTALLEKGSVLEPWGSSPMCLSIAALVPRASKRKDVDNLVKGLLDSMQGYLYPDDELVQCLTVRRLDYAGTQGHYIVHAMPIPAWTEDVIYDDPTPPRVLTGLVPWPPGP